MRHYPKYTKKRTRKTWHLGLIGILILAILSAGCVSSDRVPGEASQNASVTNITVTDTFGNTVTFPHTVHRIVCLPGTAAETLVSIGAGDQVVGVSEMTKGDSYLMSCMPDASSVGDYWVPDAEKIIALHPDVVLSYGISQSKPQNIDKILAAGIPVLYVRCYDIRDLANETRMLGRITGQESRAEENARFTEQYLEVIDDRMANISLTKPEQPEVYVERWTDYTVMAGDSPYQSLLTKLHAVNIAENIPLVQSKVSPEWIIDRNPDVIIRLAIAGDNATTVRSNLMSRPEASRTRAVQNGRVYIVYTDMLTSPRAIIGTLYIAKALYPDRFSDIDPDEILRNYSRNFLPGFSSRDTYYPLPSSFSPAGATGTPAGVPI